MSRARARDMITPNNRRVDTFGDSQPLASTIRGLSETASARRPVPRLAASLESRRRGGSRAEVSTSAETAATTIDLIRVARTEYQWGAPRTRF
jgi:hypothetical protein